MKIKIDRTTIYSDKNDNETQQQTLDRIKKSIPPNWKIIHETYWLNSITNKQCYGYRIEFKFSQNEK